MKTQCCVGSCKVTMAILFTIQHAHLWKPVIPQPFDVRCTHGPLLRDPNSISEPCCPTMLLREVSKSSNANYKLLLTFALIVGGVRVQCFGKEVKLIMQTRLANVWETLNWYVFLKSLGTFLACFGCHKSSRDFRETGPWWEYYPKAVLKKLLKNQCKVIIPTNHNS